ncbi:MAG: permease [Candidatus Heimdallarchaeota archaeon]|nr:permease [Candidatus Heimdallarchaeota archaeon]
MNIIDFFNAVLFTLVDYLSFHVLLCLVPAFFIAGAMTVFIPTDAILKYIGPDTRKIISYPSAAIAGLLLAVCSCTVLPIFAGIKKKGAGLGPAMTFFFAAPAVNILALLYTGTLIGMDIAIARAILAITFAMLIGYLMDLIFKESNQAESEEISLPRFTRSDIKKGLLIGVSLLSGIMLVLIENFFILMFFYILGSILLMYQNRVIANKSGLLFEWLVFILFVGTSRINPFNSILTLSIDPTISNMLVKILLVGFLVIYLVLFSKQELDQYEVEEWLHETWNFVKSIFPILIVGVVLAGALGYFIPTEIILTLVGSNSVTANLIAVFFGVFMYFPTLMEVPIARSFLDLGMAKGPLLAYLLADPELSIQSILVTRKYLQDKKNLVYVLLVVIFTTLSGLIFGLLLGEEIKLI